MSGNTFAFPLMELKGICELVMLKDEDANALSPKHGE